MGPLVLIDGEDRAEVARVTEDYRVESARMHSASLRQKERAALTNKLVLSSLNPRYSDCDTTCGDVEALGQDDYTVTQTQMRG